MNLKLEKYLYKSFPMIFPYKPVHNQIFKCGNEWFPIFYSLFSHIQNYINICNKHIKQKNNKIPQLIIIKIKEKQGNIQVFYKGGDKYCQSLINTIGKSICINCINNKNILLNEKFIF